jgi:hypothetical protein
VGEYPSCITTTGLFGSRESSFTNWQALRLLESARSWADIQAVFGIPAPRKIGPWSYGMRVSSARNFAKFNQRPMKKATRRLVLTMMLAAAGLALTGCATPEQREVAFGRCVDTMTICPRMMEFEYP